MSSRAQGRWASGGLAYTEFPSSLERAPCPPDGLTGVRLNSTLLWHGGSLGEAPSRSWEGSQRGRGVYRRCLEGCLQVATLPPSPSVFASDCPLAPVYVGGAGDLLSALPLTGCATLEVASPPASGDSGGHLLWAQGAFPSGGQLLPLLRAFSLCRRNTSSARSSFWARKTVSCSGASKATWSSWSTLGLRSRGRVVSSVALPALSLCAYLAGESACACVCVCV